MGKARGTGMHDRSDKLPSLVIPKNEVEAKIVERINAGKSLKDLSISSQEQMDERRSQQEKWHLYNIELLSRCFDVQTISKEYSNHNGWGTMNYIEDGLLYEIKSFREGIIDQINALESILERVELIPELNAPESIKPAPSKKDSNTVFIVHGHDEEAKSKVARFIEKLGLEAIILHEQANEGKTIIEKFEAHAINAGFAVVLLTPDDVGASKATQDKLNPRARQNAILELGYFCGSLGRNRVCVLYKEGVEMPSDYLGVIYTPLDSSDGWHLKLAKEMKTAGLDVDMNKAI